jgi:transketolase
MVFNALYASKILASEHGIHCEVINFPWLNCVCVDWLRETVSETKLVVCLDNHFSIGGLGDRVASAMMHASLDNTNFLSIGLEDVPRCGSPDEVLVSHGLAVGDIVSKILANHS